MRLLAILSCTLFFISSCEYVGLAEQIRDVLIRDLIMISLLNRWCARVVLSLCQHTPRLWWEVWLEMALVLHLSSSQRQMRQSYRKERSRCRDNERLFEFSSGHTQGHSCRRLRRLPPRRLRCQTRTVRLQRYFRAGHQKVFVATGFILSLYLISWPWCWFAGTITTTLHSVSVILIIFATRGVKQPLPLLSLLLRPSSHWPSKSNPHL